MFGRGMSSLALVFFISCFSQTFASSLPVSVLSTARAYEQQKIVTGKIISAEDNIGIPGVNVLLKGTTTGVSTDIDGNFSIEVPSPDAVLVISSVGFATQEITVGNKAEINVTLTTDVKEMQEVVVVGYGTQKKVTSTGSIETVTAKTFQDRAVTNPALALQGQTPGLVVTRTSSRPGRENIAMQIRGATSANGGSPLLVIDGVPAINFEAFYNMNPDDIQSITVLKDGSAAIYGSRAANGVILVITKKGAKGKMTVDVTSTLRMNTLGIKPPTPDMRQYATVWLEAADQDGAYPNYWNWQTRANLEQMQSGYQGIYTTAAWGDLYIGNASRYDEMFGTSYSNMQTASLSGATDKTNYRLSYGFSEDVGALKTAYDGKKQHNIRLNYDFNVTDWLKLETNVSYLKYDISSPSTGLDAASVVLDPPFFPARNPYGQWYANFNIAGNRNAIAATVDGGRENTKVDQIKVYAGATANITKDLSFKITSSYNKDFNNYQMYQLTVPQYTWFGQLSQEKVNAQSSIREQSKYTIYQNYGGFLNYTKSFGDHNITAMAGLTAELSQDKTLYGYRRGFQDLGVYDLNLGSLSELVEAKGGAGNWGLYSYVGRFTYNYKDKYLFEVSGRRDGSSKFDTGYKWSNFGSAQVGWVVSQEEFMKNIKPISLLKLRYTYGETGNQVGIGNNDYVSQISNGSALFGSVPAFQNSAWVNGISSNERVWERVIKKTYGVDFGLLDGKIFGYYDYFNTRNTNMFINVQYPDVLGGTAPKSNAGQFDVRGWEFSLGYRGEVGKFKYSVSANMSDTRNKITSMKNANVIRPGLNSTANSYNVEGYPINSYFMYETAGFFQNQEQVDAYYDTYGGKGDLAALGTDQTRLRPGDIIKVDRNGDGVINQEDLKFVGDAAPHYVYGLNLTGQYGGFDITAFFQGVLEQDIQRIGYMAYPFATLYTNQTTAYIGKTWTEQNTGAAFPRMTANLDRAKWNWLNNDFALQNNRYIRMKSLVVGYTLTDLKVADYTIPKVRLYFSGNDLFEFTKVKDGYDPEFGESSNTTYPYNRTWSLGLNVTF